MIIERGSVSGFSSTLNSQYLNHDTYGTSSQLFDGATTTEGGESSGTQLVSSLLFSLSFLKEKMHEVESFVSIFLVHENYHNSEAVDELALSSMAQLMQELVEAASCTMLNCQKMTSSCMNQQVVVFEKGSDSYSNWLIPQDNLISSERVVELEASDLLVRHTLYCKLCGRGFKREANLKMHMRSHGDKYNKLSLKNHLNNPETRYSCPHQGCRWNKKHPKFQPLKSLVCVKNHYKRSHCPKMFMCKRCNTKHYSVLSDLKMHEKHCGDTNTKCYCSCGTSFSNKDKLMDHVAFFVGHTPFIN